MVEEDHRVRDTRRYVARLTGCRGARVTQGSSQDYRRALCRSAVTRKWAVGLSGYVTIGTHLDKEGRTEAEETAGQIVAKEL
jgi:hypothetical protein